MPRNASGVYSLPNPPVVTDTTILSNDENVTRDDLAAEITNSLDRNGRGGMLAPFRIFDGTLATPGLAFLNEINSGIWRAGANDIRMVVAAADVMKFTPGTVTIPVGIGFNVLGAVSIGGNLVVNPGSLFAEFDSNSTQYLAQLRNVSGGTAAQAGIAIGNDTSGFGFTIALNSSTYTGASLHAKIQNEFNAPLNLGAGGATQVRIDPSAGPNFLTLTGGTNPTIGTNGGYMNIVAPGGQIYCFAGGVSNEDSILRINGSSGATKGPLISLMRNGVSVGGLGTLAPILGSGSSSDICVYSESGAAIRIMTNGDAVNEKVNVGPTGVVNIRNLAGAGTRPVVADAAGNLSAP